MKIATGNRLNEFWRELKEVLVPRSKVLKTLEEIEANTNEENIAGATALKEVNNKLMSMTDNDAIKGLDVREDGVYMTYVPAEGADPVSKKLGSPDFDVVKTYTLSNNGSITIDTSEYKQIVIFSNYTSAANPSLSPSWSQISSASSCKIFHLGTAFIPSQLAASCYILIANADTCTITFTRVVCGNIYLIK